MQSVKLTLLIEEGADLDMEVRVVNTEQATGANTAPVTTLRPRVVTVGRDDDEYTLGGYAGI
ncbi:hypothetical protein KR767_07250 [Luteibacter anthropi]|uniref:hypothetical protein n=1 Tax=Luteibacter anthropi TaxID=564369 RepID=UPI0020325A52|nr:hypothetical protein [Luteibacter anthropi]URX63842.1 hypothetical protein KR767_07250 [Luteibacter anthropi]